MEDTEESCGVSNKANYNVRLNASAKDIVMTYIQLCCNYLILVQSSRNCGSSTYATRFIFIRGLEMMTNIFNVMLLTTKNISMTLHHTTKSMFLYVEFVSQMNDNEFLKLTSKDAVIYIYKKSIFKLIARPDVKRNLSELKKITYVNDSIYVVRYITEKLIEFDCLSSENSFDTIYNLMLEKVNNLRKIKRIVLTHFESKSYYTYNEAETRWKELHADLIILLD